MPTNRKEDRGFTRTPRAVHYLNGVKIHDISSWKSLEIVMDWDNEDKNQIRWIGNNLTPMFKNTTITIEHAEEK